MAKIKTNQSQEFQLRPGSEAFGGAGWGDVDTESDPGSIAPNDFQRAENVRPQGKNLTNRPGLIPKIDLSLYSSRAAGVGAIQWANEAAGNATQTRLWLSTLGCVSAAASGFNLVTVDPTRNPRIQVYADARAVANRFTPLAGYGDRLFVGDSHLLKEVIQISVPSGMQISSLLGSGAQPLYEQRVFDGYTIRCMRQHDGFLFIGLENNTVAANSKIVVYDGQQYRDDLTGVRPPIAFGQWQNKLVCGFDATAGHIQVRNSSTTVPGTWTTYSLGGFQTSINQNAMQECRDKLYIASGATQLYSFDGATLAAANTIATADATGDGVSALCLHDGLLHYGWNTTVTLNAQIGRHDPDSTATEWTDTYLDITAQVANFKRIGSIASYRRQLYCGGQGGTAQWLVATAPNDVKGTVVVISSVASGASFRARQLLVYP